MTSVSRPDYDRLLMGSPLRRRGVCLVICVALLTVLFLATLVHLGLLASMRRDVASVFYRALALSSVLAVSPHNYNSTTVALSATVHASACMPNFIITEYFLPFEELGQRLCPNVLRPVDGYIALPDGPGLGLSVDEKAVRAAKGKQFPARTFRSLAEEGP